MSEIKKLMSCGARILKCKECDLDLSLKFSHYFLNGYLLCGCCRAQFDDNGIKKKVKKEGVKK